MKSSLSHNWQNIIWREWRNCTDEEVERFAVQIGNDTDPMRKFRYKQLACLVDSQCQLTENSWRILRSLFGSVESKTLYIPQIA